MQQHTNKYIQKFIQQQKGFGINTGNAHKTQQLLLQLLQPFYGSLDIVRVYPGKLLPER